MIHHLAPVLHVNSIEENISFFKKLGFDVEFEWGDPVDYVIIKKNQASLHLSKAIKTHINSQQIDFYIFVEDIHSFYLQLQENAIAISTPLGKREYGMWDFDIVTPDQYNLSFGEGV